jgi:hypothetical protein
LSPAPRSAPFVVSTKTTKDIRNRGAISTGLFIATCCYGSSSALLHFWERSLIFDLIGIAFWLVRGVWPKSPESLQFGRVELLALVFILLVSFLVLFLYTVTAAIKKNYAGFSLRIEKAGSLALPAHKPSESN